MNFFIEKAIKCAHTIESVPIYKCGPSDDPDKQYAYATSFRDSVASFLFYVKKIQDPTLQELLIGIDDDIDSGNISASHIIRSKLRVVADYLEELYTTPDFKEVIFVNESFVDKNLVKKLKAIESIKYDLRKLVKFIEELNYSYQCEHYLSSVLLLRAIINHIPPIFNATTFAQVVASSKRSIKAILSILEDDTRPIADMHTHMMIRNKESLPTRNQVEPYKAAFEVLLNEIIHELSGDPSE